ncbi:MAG: SH3 domain-containing protein [Ruminococcus sp.]|nr:SH3 domain-containing protein [Ruminococcus sp.]
MNNRREKKAVITAAVLAVFLAGCSMFNESSAAETTTAQTVTAERRTVITTKVAELEIKPDNDDEGAEGYTTTTTVTGHLDTDFSMDDGYDMKIRATMTSKTEETLPPPDSSEEVSEASTETKKSTTTTAFKNDALFDMPDEAAYSSSKKYKVTSDTTYLNLRFGPSRMYDVQLQIPDGVEVTGYGKMMESATGEEWVYIDYNGTKGWVMRKLLS